ncbi:MAG: TIM-barrel domain-containing protein [Flavisolibacter sp.]
MAIHAQENYSVLEDGIVVYPQRNVFNDTRSVRLRVFSKNIIEVIAGTEHEVAHDTSLMVIATPAVQTWKFYKNGNDIILDTDSIKVHVNHTTGKVSFMGSKGEILLNEGGRHFSPVTIDAGSAYQVKQLFLSTSGEAFYGLGQHQEGIMNYKGDVVDLLQINTEVAVPFLLSSRNYGLLWENYSISKFGDVRNYEPLNHLKIYDSEGAEGGLTAEYIRKNSSDVILKRTESVIDYDDLPSLSKFPGTFSLNEGKVIWSGSFQSAFTGLHKFKVRYGGYLKMWIGNRLVLDRWRQCWNPATAIVPVTFAANKKYPVKIEWIPDGGESFISCSWLRPATKYDNSIFEFSSEAAHHINYYFIAGHNADDVIAGYRLLTGKAPMVPKWALGFWQSRERYKTQQEVMSTVRSFREKNIPLDNIVLDWQYWKPDQWGSQQFDTTRFPDPAGMIDSLHRFYKAHLMISVWPKFYKGIKNFNLLNEKGWLLTKNIEENRKDWLGYVSTFYDAFNPEAGKFFWQLVKDNLYSKGVDAWWMDAPEPDIHSNLSVEQRKHLMYPNAIGSADLFFNAYPLVNAKTIYEGLRSADNSKRSFILTRSAYGGLQRYGAAVWSGDIGSRWEDMKNQVSAGVNFSMSGIPWWTMDIGGFAVEHRYENAKGEQLKEWKELQTRWYQFGAFCPLFRAHGQFPYREIYNISSPGDSAYESILFYNKLRYRLMPYLYSLAGEVYQKDYTLMRGLIMDFANDKKVYSINDQYLFGPSLLINPVTTYGARSRKVYLPTGQGWYDLYTGKFYKGGQVISASADLEHIPVFVKEGSIIPFGPDMKYTSEKPADTVSLFIYAGKNAMFDLYEDDGITNDYENGKSRIIPILYNEAAKTLTIEKVKGNYSAPVQHFFKISLMKHDSVSSLQFDSYQYSLNYSGEQISIQLTNKILK